MSASSGSERLRRLARPIAASALVGMALFALAGVSVARISTRSYGDSGEYVRRIKVGPAGIVIDRGEGDSVVSDYRYRPRRIHTRFRSHGGLIEIDDGGEGIVRILSDASVPAGKKIDGDVVAVCGSVDVAGEVTGDVVSVLGSVRLQNGARVHGNAVSIGGGLDQADSASIDGQAVQMGLTPFTWGLPALPVMLISITIGWVVSLFVGWIFVLLFPSGVLRVATVVERRPAASFFLGVLSVPMFFVALALLIVTVIGIPLGILLPMFYILAGYAGQLAATTVLGARLMRRPLGDGLIAPLTVGTLFIAVMLGAGAVLSVYNGWGHPAALFFTLSGTLLLLGMGALGTGAFLLSRFGTRPREVSWAGQRPVSGGVPGASAPPVSA